METIKYILTVFFKLAVGILVVAFVWWMVTIIFPAASFSSIRSSMSQNASSTKQGMGDLLPDPRTYANLFKKVEPSNGQTNLYKPGAPYGGNATNQSGYTNSQAGYVTYSDSGMMVTNSDGTQISYKEYTANEAALLAKETAVKTEKNTPQQKTGYSKKELYIRNLSIYEGGHIYTGLSFVGEARSTMFINGKFPIVIVDGAGRVVTVTYAESTTDWSAPGWLRFQAKITTVLPNKVQCGMIFEQARSSSQYPYNDAASPVRVAIPILCN